MIITISGKANNPYAPLIDELTHLSQNDKKFLPKHFLFTEDALKFIKEHKKEINLIILNFDTPFNKNGEGTYLAGKKLYFDLLSITKEIIIFSEYEIDEVVSHFKNENKKLDKKTNYFSFVSFNYNYLLNTILKIVKKQTYSSQPR